MTASCGDVGRKTATPEQGPDATVLLTASTRLCAGERRNLGTAEVRALAGREDTIEMLVAAGEENAPIIRLVLQSELCNNARDR